MSLLNKKKTKQFILSAVAAAGRAEKFTRVGAESFDFLEGKLRALIESEIKSHPFVGKTLYLGGRQEAKPQEPSSP